MTLLSLGERPYNEDELTSPIVYARIERRSVVEWLADNATLDAITAAIAAVGLVYVVFLLLTMAVR